MSVINDLIQPLTSKLRQRTDMSPFYPYYIAQAILDITQNNEFEDLKVTGPLVQFQVKVAEYPILGNPFMLGGDLFLTHIYTWFVYFDPSGVVTPGVSTGKQLDKRHIRIVEPMSKILGIPSVYTQHGSYKNGGKLIVGQMPDNPYSTQMRYQRQHPFSIPYQFVLQANNDASLSSKLGTSFIFLPDDWTEVIVLTAAEKVCDDVGMSEIGQLYHQKLFGYQDKRGNNVAGLINVKQSEEERNSLFNSRALRPIVRRFT
jgi:hypothetical protein